MESLGHINAAEEFGFFDVTRELINIWQLICFLQGEVIQLAEVPARPLRQVRLGLEVHGGGPRLLGFFSCNLLDNPHLYHLVPGR